MALILRMLRYFQIWHLQPWPSMRARKFCRSALPIFLKCVWIILGKHCMDDTDPDFDASLKWDVTCHSYFHAQVHHFYYHAAFPIISNGDYCRYKNLFLCIGWRILWIHMSLYAIFRFHLAISGTRSLQCVAIMNPKGEVIQRFTMILFATKIKTFLHSLMQS